MHLKRLSIVVSGLLVLPVARLDAQGAGSAGAQILQFSAGSRASAFSGAYTASSEGSDVLFYNPAGAAALRIAGAISFETMVQDVTLSSFSGALRLGPVTVGLSGMFLDAGTVDVLVPDPNFGGSTGIATGANASATEGVA